MYTEYFLINYLQTPQCWFQGEQWRTHSSNSEEVKHSTAVLPGICVSILVLTLICGRERLWATLEKLELTIESIHLSDLPTLMVPSQENHFVRVHGFEG